MMTATATTPRRPRQLPTVPAASFIMAALAVVVLLAAPRSAEGGFAGVVVPARTAAAARCGTPQKKVSLFLLNSNKAASDAAPEVQVGIERSASSPFLQRSLATAAWMTTAVMIPAATAWAAAASEGDNEYVYGAVDAPIGLAVGAGILAIATAALPVLLRGGEQAFEEIRERDEGTFGSPDKNKDVLKSRRK